MQKHWFHICSKCFTSKHKCTAWGCGLIPNAEELAIIRAKIFNIWAKCAATFTYKLGSVYCCNLSGGVALIVWFTTNGMCVKNNCIIYVARARNSKRDCEHDLYCCLLPRCEALCTCRSGFPIATPFSQQRQNNGQVNGKIVGKMAKTI